MIEDDYFLPLPSASILNPQIMKARFCDPPQSARKINPENLESDKQPSYNDQTQYDESQSVPNIKIQTKIEKLKLNNKIQIKSKKIDPSYFYAYGQLKSSKKKANEIQNVVLFRGNFEGIFKAVVKNKLEDIQSINEPKKQHQFYFEGLIDNLTDHKICFLEGNQASEQQTIIRDHDIIQEQFQNMSIFRGVFIGHFIHQSLVIKYSILNQHQSKILSESIQKQFQGCSNKSKVLCFNDYNDDLIFKKKKNIDYFLKTVLNFDLMRISKFNLEKSMAQIVGTFHLFIQFDRQVLQLLKYDYRTRTFGVKQYVMMDLHRGRPIRLPLFHDKPDDQGIIDEWAEDNDGVNVTTQWDCSKLTMKICALTSYNAEIDNYYGIFFSPFNVNELRIVITLHCIQFPSSQDKINIRFNCCDLTDFSLNEGKYNPYVNTNELKRYNALDRLTKINYSNCTNTGQYKLCTNKFRFFPYYKRVFKNKNTLLDTYGWKFGFESRQNILKQPFVYQTVVNFQKLFGQSKIQDDKTKCKIFNLQKWQYYHLQMPIYKYPAIIIFQIIIPMVILMIISAFVFVQQNSTYPSTFDQGSDQQYEIKNYIGYRIASSCSLLVATLALIPTIRRNLPPTPRMTLIDILIILMTIPNILAIISVFYCKYKHVEQFKKYYQPQKDTLFIISIFIWGFQFFILLFFSIFIFSYRNGGTLSMQYSNINKYPLKRARNPMFIQYIKELKNKRKELTIYEAIDNLHYPDFTY